MASCVMKDLPRGQWGGGSPAPSSRPAPLPVTNVANVLLIRQNYEWRVATQDDIDELQGIELLYSALMDEIGRHKERARNVAPMPSDLRVSRQRMLAKIEGSRSA